MKHGEKIVGRIGWGKGRNNFLSYRFRYDPVPFTGITYNGRWYRRPKTTQERRLSLSCSREYVRAKR